MPITPFLSGKTFNPEAVAVMGRVFVDLCERLALTEKTDPATRLVAETIIELASTGRCDEKGLRTAALRAFDLRE